jgi:hypothetical protein
VPERVAWSAVAHGSGAQDVSVLELDDPGHIRLECVEQASIEPVYLPGTIAPGCIVAVVAPAADAAVIASISAAAEAAAVTLPIMRTLPDVFSPTVGRIKSNCQALGTSLRDKSAR